MPYCIWIVLRDAPIWFDKHPNNCIINHISTCINRIKYETMKNDIKRFIAYSARNTSLINNARGQELRHNRIRGAAIIQLSRNCTSLIGAQISTLHIDSVAKSRLIKKLSKHVQEKISQQKYKILRNSGGSDHISCYDRKMLEDYIRTRKFTDLKETMSEK